MLRRLFLVTGFLLSMAALAVVAQRQHRSDKRNDKRWRRLEARIAIIEKHHRDSAEQYQKALNDWRKTDTAGDQVISMLIETMEDFQTEIDYLRELRQNEAKRRRQSK